MHKKGLYDEAAQSLEEAIDLDYQPATAMYYIACCHALVGHAGAARGALESAVESGTIHHGHLEGDSDLDNLRGESRFQALLERLEAEQKREQTCATRFV